jgi:hypothetical protein
MVLFFTEDALRVKQRNGGKNEYNEKNLGSWGSVTIARLGRNCNWRSGCIFLVDL